MDKQEFIELVNSKLKLIRVENDLSQEKMSEVIGLSKKTLVEIEKGRKMRRRLTSYTVSNWMITKAFNDNL